MVLTFFLPMLFSHDSFLLSILGFVDEGLILVFFINGLCIQGLVVRIGLDILWFASF